MHFSQDWFSRHIPVWSRLLAEFKGRPGIRALEIGSFEGRSTCWLLENILTGDGAHIDCIDTFQGSEELVGLKIDTSDLRKTFEENIWPWRDRVTVHVGKSETELRRLSGSFDLVYVDGSHAAPDVLTDTVLSWPLLKDRGIMIFDDYLWQLDPRPEHRPRLAIDSFLSCHKGGFEVLLSHYQVAVRKREPDPQASTPAAAGQDGSFRSLHAP